MANESTPFFLWVWSCVVSHFFVLIFYLLTGCSAKSHSSNTEASWDKVDPLSERSPALTFRDLMRIIRCGSFLEAKLFSVVDNAKCIAYFWVLLASE